VRAHADRGARLAPASSRGHALLHGEGPVASREVAEVEVESVAYIVCDALGIDRGP
jgi:hypothetical protein